MITAGRIYDVLKRLYDEEYRLLGMQADLADDEAQGLATDYDRRKVKEQVELIGILRNEVIE